jgi:hypothetical protein
MDANPVARKTTKTPMVWIACVLLAILAAYGLYENFLMSARIAFAEDQTAIFDEMRRRAETEDPAEGVKSLQYAVLYYASGTKQVAGSRLDQVVERSRRNAVRQIIDSLRKKTGQDFGDDPQSWLERGATLKSLEGSRRNR